MIIKNKAECYHLALFVLYLQNRNEPKMKLNKHNKDSKSNDEHLWWIWLLLTPIIIAIPLSLAVLVCYGMYCLFNLIKEPIETLIYIGGIILGIIIAGGIIWFFFWTCKQYYNKNRNEKENKLKVIIFSVLETLLTFIIAAVIIAIIVIIIGSFLDSCHRLIPPIRN